MLFQIYELTVVNRDLLFVRFAVYVVLSIRNELGSGERAKFGVFVNGHLFENYALKTTCPPPARWAISARRGGLVDSVSVCLQIMAAGHQFKITGNRFCARARP